MSDIKIKASLDTTEVSPTLAKLKANFKAFSDEVGKGVLGRDSTKAFKDGLGGAGVALAAIGLGFKIWQAGIEKCTAALKDYRDGMVGVNQDMALAGQLVEGTQNKLGKWAGTVIGSLAKGMNALFGTGTADDILKAEKKASEAQELLRKTLEDGKKVAADQKKTIAEAAEKKAKWQSEPAVNERASNLRMLEAELGPAEKLAEKKREALQIDLERQTLQSQYGKDEETRYNAQVEVLKIKKQIQDIDKATAKEASDRAKEQVEAAKKEAEIVSQINSLRGSVHTSGMLSSGISTAGERAFTSGVDKQQLQKLTEQLKELRDIKNKVTYGYVQK